MAPQAETDINLRRNPQLPPVVDIETKQIPPNSILQKICNNNSQFKPFEFSQNIISNGKFFIETNKNSLLRVSSQRYAEEELFQIVKLKLFFESLALTNSKGEVKSDRTFTLITRYKVSTFTNDEGEELPSFLVNAEDIYGKSFISNHYERKEKQCRDLLTSLPQESHATLTDSLSPQGFANLDPNTFTRSVFAPNKTPVTITISVDPEEEVITAFLVPCLKNKVYNNDLWFKEISNVSLKSLSSNNYKEKKPLMVVTGIESKSERASTYYFTFDEESRKITLEENINVNLIK